MLIFGFDCGTVNFGVACVEYQKSCDVSKLAKSITCLYSAESLELPKDQWLIKIRDCFREVYDQLGKIIQIKFVNTFQLIPELNATNKHLVMERLSDVLNSLVATVGIPDDILIEKQMSINTTAMDIVGGIEMFFRNLKDNRMAPDKVDKSTNKDDRTINKDEKDNIPVTFDYWPIKWSRPRNNINIVIVSPVAKNTVALGGNDHGDFIAKYSTNYTANKNHADANFMYFIETFGPRDLIKFKKTKQKTNDSADAFMMVLAYIKRL